MGKFSDIKIRWRTRLCSVNGEYGNFHVWEQYSEPVGESPLVGGPPAGVVAGVYGIVEFPDGIRRVDPAAIRFVDMDHKNLYSMAEYLARKKNPQRTCTFCHYVRDHEDTMTDDGRYKVWLTKITPMPAIDLMTGETAETADPPFYAMMMDGEDVGEDILPIKFCPMCGRKLKVENEKTD